MGSLYVPVDTLEIPVGVLNVDFEVDLFARRDGRLVTGFVGSQGRWTVLGSHFEDVSSTFSVETIFEVSVPFVSIDRGPDVVLTGRRIFFYLPLNVYCFSGTRFNPYLFVG
ncbi:hypothetical protein DJ83_16260 [Halorubrum ezzemoulense]|uniref:Uncharacterized protein n=1 Tax=Halorubrum ezzemoulense TaxID=337243 RepID=A0A256KES2_HALEZ|nr:hypothetical protein DJ83_16260 [Halorubrum ezzemoulense]OYR79550.1 hypothetical protein DJ84_17600 [Halorubrum ezzemoulense]